MTSNKFRRKALPMICKIKSTWSKKKKMFACATKHHST